MLRFEIGNRQIYITRTVADIFFQYRQLEQMQDERGGIVLGQITENAQQILVSRASIPSNKDMHKRYSFKRSRNWAQEIVQYEFHNSGGRNTYLGEWHTHPSRQATPSAQDLRMIKEQFAVNDIRTDLLLLFIVAWEELFIGLYDGQRMPSITTGDFSTANRSL